MLFNLSVKNIKKSIKDYSIYFFTLVIAVAIFYAFNSIDSQQAMLMMNNSKREIVQTLIELIGYVSIFISFILGFLIIYSNNFLIKRRKKEFGLYLTLGMSKRKVSLILVIETLLVGLISLVVGLLLGVFLSQLMSLFTANLFEVNMTKFTFVFSLGALYKTLIYFSIIFLLVMIFNVISLSKNKIIKLLTAGKKNEKVRMRNKYVIAISFILSLGLLIYAYKLLFDGAMFAADNRIVIMLITGALGTFFFFFSVAGFFIKILERIKKVYYKNLNMFVLKQINSKANSTVFSTTVICLMLLLTIGILSGSISLVSVFNDDIESNNRTDFTIEKHYAYYEVDENGKMNYKNSDYTVEDMIKADDFSKYVKEYRTFYEYTSEDVLMKNLMTQEEMDNAVKEYGNEITFDTNITIMKESDYNGILDLFNQDNMKVDIKENEYLLTANLDKISDFFKELYAKGNTIKINDKELIPMTREIVKVGFKNSSSASNFGAIIVDDSNIKNLDMSLNNLIGNYVETDDTETLEKDFISSMTNFGPISYSTRLKVNETNIGMKAMLTFIGLYLGIIFAITSATILAIGQLSESSDNKGRYKILKQLGAESKMIKRSLLIQIGVAFITPLIVAMFHAYFGLRELNGMIELLGDIDLSSNIALTGLFIVIVYGGYFVATYFCSKTITKNN